jgi:hypothetical protein
MINKVVQGTFLLIVQRQATRTRIRAITNARRRPQTARRLPRRCLSRARKHSE